jgi:mRNA interferase RelE/StbE
MHSLVIKKSAKKELDRLTDQIFEKIDTAILKLKEEPFPFPQSKKLKGENKRRLHIGDYRVIYTVNEGRKTITIVKIRHRKEVYR